MKATNKTKEALLRELEEWKLRFESLQQSYKEQLADLRLKEGDTHLRLLFENMHQGIVYQDAMGRVINANPAAERILGISLDQMQGKSSEKSPFKTVRENGTDYPFEEHPAIIAIHSGKPVEDAVMGVIHPDQQKTTWILVSSRPEFREHDAHPFRVFTTLTDITDRKLAEDKLRERETMLSNLVNSQTNYVLRTDLEGRYTYWNHKYESEFGWIHENTGMTGSLALETICKHHHQRALEIVEKCLKNPGVIIKVELDKPARDGGVVTTLWEFVCLADTTGNPSEIQCMGIDITESKEKEKAIRESEEKYRTLFHYSPDAYSITQEGKIAECNTELARLLGGDRNSVEGLPIAAVSPEYQPCGRKSEEYAAEMIRKALETGNITFEWVHLRLDGSEFLAQITLNPIMFHGNPALFARWQDITRQKKTEDALRQSEERYRLITENSETIVFEFDEKGICRYLSPVVERVTGFKPGDLVGTVSFNDLVNESHRKILDNLFLSQKPFNNITVPGNARDGRTIWIETNGTPIFDNDGKFKGFIGGYNDVTQRYLAENELRKFRSISDNANYGNAIASLDGLLLYSNHHFAAMHGFTVEEIVGKNLSMLHSQQQMELVGRSIEILKENGEFQALEIWRTRKDGSSFPSLMNAMVVHENGVPQFMWATAIDITEKKLAEQEILDLNANLEKKIEERTQELLRANEELVNEVDTRKMIEKKLSHEKIRLDNIILSTGIGTWEWNIPEGQLVFNERWAGMLGYTMEELTPANTGTWERLSHPEDLKEAWQHLEKHFIRQEKVYEVEIRMRHKHGEWIWVLSWGSVLEWDDKGKPLKMAGTHLEITERKKEEALQEELLNLSLKINEVSVAGIPSAISTALERVGNFLGVDRSYVFEYFPDRTMNPTYEWYHPDFLPLIGRIKDLPLDMVPEWENTLQTKEMVYVQSVDDLPVEWEKERRIWQENGVKTVFVVPLIDRGEVMGFIGVDTMRDYRIYNEYESKMLPILANMIVSLVVRKKVEEKLEMTRQNYHEFFNNVDDFLFVLDERWNIIYHNKTVTRRLGYTPEELTGQSVLLIHPEERRAEAGRIVAEMLTGQTEYCSVPLMTRSGKYIPVETRINKGQWNGKPVIFGVTKDVSAIRLSEEKFSKAFHVSAVMMAISDFDTGSFIDVNNAFLKRLGYRKEEVIGKTSAELNLFPDRLFGGGPAENSSDEYPVHEAEIMVHAKSGDQISGLFSREIIFIGVEKCLLTMVVDITERKNFEKDLLATKMEAEKANMAKSEFLSRMSHELRTPMNSILGFAQLLNMGELNPSQKKGVGHIMHSGKHLLGLINEVLDISRIEAGHLSLSMEPVQIRSVITETFDVVQLQANEKRVTLELFESVENNLFINADRQRFKQILLNLVSNAIKYNNPGGLVRITIDRRDHVEESQACVRISVSDTGQGITGQDIPKLFQPFERFGAENLPVEGTGLGLVVTRKLVDALGGIIGVESIVGEGTTFWIEFAECQGPTAEQVRRTALASDMRANDEKSGTILYIEDNPSNIELVDQILCDHRPNVNLITGMEGSMAMTLALQHKPSLILLDLNLPDIHGSEVIRQLKEEPATRDIPVVIISADAMPQQINRMLKTGASRYLSKPLDINAFLEVVDTCLG